MPLAMAFDGVLNSGNPAAVLWRVRTIVVDAIYGQALLVTIGHRPVAERLKGPPLIADLDAPRSVVFELVMVGVCAATAHVVEKTIQTGLRLVVGPPWRWSALDAAAGNLPSLTKIAAISRDLISATAAAMPNPAFDPLDDKQSPELLPCEVNETHGGMSWER
jgi:hypothetical protein